MSIKELLFGFLKRYPILVFFQFLFTILTFLIEIVIIPRILGRLFANQSNLSILRKEFILLFVSWVFMQLFNILGEYTYDLIYMRLEKYVIDQLYTKVLHRMEQSVDSENIVFIHNNISCIKDACCMLIYYICRLAPRIIALFITSVYLFFVNKTIGSISIVSMFLFLIILVNSLLKSSENKSKKQYKIVLDQINDTFGNINIVRSTENGVHTELSKIRDSCDLYSELEHNEIISYRINQWIVYCISTLMSGVMLWILYSYRLHDKIQLEELSSIILTIPSYVSQINTVIFFFPKVLIYLYQLKHYDAWVSELYQHTVVDQMPKPEHSNVKLDHLTFSYPDQEPIFTDWSITLPTGLIWLKGESGAGKTTVLKLLMGLVQPTHGTITLGDVVITSSIKQHVVYLHQHAMTLFNTTLYNNIVYGNNDIQPIRITELLHRYQLFSIFGCKEGDVRGSV